MTRINPVRYLNSRRELLRRWARQAEIWGRACEAAGCSEKAGQMKRSRFRMLRMLEETGETVDWGF